MKLKLLAAACATLASTGAFAACPAANATINASCVLQAPAKTYYIAGASAQAQAFNAIAPTLFDTPADVIKITAVAPAPDTANQDKHVAYYGLRGGVATAIVYRNSGGSGSGIRQLVSKTAGAYTAIPNSPAVGTENVAMNLTGCAAVSNAAAPWTTTCSGSVAQVPVAALSDVLPGELSAGLFPPAGANYFGPAALDVTTTSLQGFGVVVNAALKTKLVQQNAREGRPVDATGQPSIRRADYASLVSVEGGIKDAASLLNDPSDTTAITVCRRTDTSGTQAASNLFFLNNVSGLKGFGGALNPESVAAPGVTYNLASSSSNALTCLAGSGYRIGVLSLENIPSGWSYVKIDGVSPDFSYDLNGTTIPGAGIVKNDPKQRQQMAAGYYPFAYQSVVAITPTAPAAVKTLRDDIVLKLSDSTASDLAGFAYQDLPGTWNRWDSTVGAPSNLQSRVTRTGNNSQPLLP